MGIRVERLDYGDFFRLLAFLFFDGHDITRDVDLLDVFTFLGHAYLQNENG
ncbi:hypothetical protein D3C72_2390160 [compost metagenome]